MFLRFRQLSPIEIIDSQLLENAKLRGFHLRIVRILRQQLLAKFVGAPEPRFRQFSLTVIASRRPGPLVRVRDAHLGEVLADPAGAFLARGMTAWDAARLAVFIHGRAGDLAAAAVGVDSLIASDLIERLPRAMIDACVRSEEA